jgi:uncharacterized protein YdeI (YjbR/CyaY-like superfamily)
MMPDKTEDVREDKTLNRPERIELQVISFVSITEFENWLEHNNHEVTGIWVRFFKKNSDITTIIYDEALDIALCYGWIDGQVKKYDEYSYLQKFTPRRSKSMWSKRNKDHVLRLGKEGKMKPSGIKEVENAKKDGRWERAYDSPGNITVPEDFMLELSKNKKALEFFESLNKVNKYSIGWRLQTAKNKEMRERRMFEILNMMEKGLKFH